MGGLAHEVGGLAHVVGGLAHVVGGSAHVVGGLAHVVGGLAHVYCVVPVSKLLAKPCNPATGGQEYWDGAGHPNLNNLVEFEMAKWSRVCEIPLVLTTLNCGIARGSGGTRHKILLPQLLTERLPIEKTTISIFTREE